MSGNNEESFMEIGDIRYRIGTLDPFKQLPIAKRLLGALSTMTGTEGESLNARLMRAVSSLSDEDLDMIVKTSLLAVRREVEKGGGFTPIYSKNGGLMFQDITLPTMIKLTVRVVKDNLSDFFTELLSLSPDQAPGEEGGQS